MVNCRPTDSTVSFRASGREDRGSIDPKRSTAGIGLSSSTAAFTGLSSKANSSARAGRSPGAFDSKQGLFRAASGTLFLKVADMSLTTQVKILRVLEERKISPVGSTEQHAIDVRIIAATNKSMEEEVRKKNFREDLYYRLNVIPLYLPALRDRKDDIPLLTGHFLAKYSRQMRKNVTRISDRARQALYDYDWPGNVRELENIIQRHVALSGGDTIENLTISGRPEKSAELAPAALPRADSLIGKRDRSRAGLGSYKRSYRGLPETDPGQPRSAASCWG
jgi:DNA-binding NtrC family response regulator